MRQFHNLGEYFNVEMSVPWLMKYCPHQIYELDLIFHISYCTRCLGKSLSNSPTILFPSSCLSGLHFMSRKILLLGIVYSSVSLVIGAGADMSLGGDMSVTTRYASLSLLCSGVSLSALPLPGAVVSSDQVCSGHAE